MSGFPICSTVLVSRGHSVFLPDSCFLNGSVKEDMKSASKGLPSLIRRCVFIGGQMPTLGFPGGSEVKASACNAGDLGSTPGSGRSPGEGNGNPLQCSCLENPMDGGAWWATVHGSQRVGHNWATNTSTHITFWSIISNLQQIGQWQEATRSNKTFCRNDVDHVRRLTGGTSGIAQYEVVSAVLRRHYQN